MRIKPLLTLAACAAAAGVLFIAVQDETGHRSDPSMEINTTSICTGNTGKFTVEVHDLPLRGEGNYTLNIAEGDHTSNVSPRFLGTLSVSRTGEASSKTLPCPTYLGKYTATVTQGGKEVVSTTFVVPEH